MNSMYRVFLGTLVVVGLLALAASASARQKQSIVQQNNTAYSASRETTLSGTVISFTEGSPAGAHLILNNSSVVSDVNVGNAKLLSLNGLTFAPGDTVRVTGETLNVAGSTFFAARIVQKGAQSLTVRSIRGFVLQPVRGNVPASALKLGGIL